MKNIFIITSIILISIIFSGCQTKKTLTKGFINKKFYENQPKSILILPAINNTTSALAADQLRYALTKPLTEMGYYIFPVHLVKKFFDSENLYEGRIIQSIPIEKLNEVFNADAILYIDVLAWDTNYKVIESSVEITYKLKLIDTKTNKEILNTTAYGIEATALNLSNGIIEGIVQGLIDSALNSSTDYLNIAYKTNNYLFANIPHGIYSDKFKNDLNDSMIYFPYIYGADPFMFGGIVGPMIKENKLLVHKNFIESYNTYLEEKISDLNSQLDEIDFLENRFHSSTNDAEYSKEDLIKQISSIKKSFLNKGEIRFNPRNLTIRTYGEVIDAQWLKHTNFEDYYYYDNGTKKHKFFLYEDNKPFLVSNYKKVFLLTDNSGNIPYEKESNFFNRYYSYSFSIDKIIDFPEEKSN